MMRNLSILIILFYAGVFFCCTPNFDNETIAIIGRQRISKTLFHKQVPKIHFNSLNDSLKIEKVENFIKELLVKKDIKKMQLQNNYEIEKEMNLWSKRTVAGLLFDKKILNKIFPEDSLKHIYNNYRTERNISVIVIPYIKVKTDKIPDKIQAKEIAENIYNRSKTEDFTDLQNKFSKIVSKNSEKYSHWTQLFRGIKAVDKELWSYKVGQVTRPIDDGQSIRIIKINSERENNKIPPYESYKDQLIKQVLELWIKPLQDYFIFVTDSLLKVAEFYIDEKKVLEFSENLKNNVNDDDIIYALKKSNYNEKLGRYNNVYLDREWFLEEFISQENIFAHQLADKNIAVGFIKGLISSKVNYDAGIKMGIQNNPTYKEKYEKELNTRMRNFYDFHVYYNGLELTEDEIFNYYNDNIKSFRIAPKILAQLIWFGSENMADYHSKKLEKGELTFDEFYNSVKNSTAKRTGVMKKFISPSSETDPYKALFSLENGSISKPFKRGNKFYITKVIEKIGAQQRSFKEVRAQIQMRLSKNHKNRNNIIARKRLLQKFNASINEDLIQS